MNKTFLTRIALGLSLLTMAGQVSAQRAITYEGNWAIDQAGTRFTVNQPASIAGVKIINAANEGVADSCANGRADWGGEFYSPLNNVSVVKAFDTLGISTLLNGTGSYPSLTGKIALIFRGGNITFTRKARLCQNAGAVACIIVNNIPGGPVGMAETTTEGCVNIPVFMVSDVDGIAMNNILKSGDSVKVSLTKWGTGSTHDLGILMDGIVLPHASVIPAAQLVASNGNPLAYKNQTGAYIANFGSSNETGIKVRSNVSWTPTSGGSTIVHSDSIAVASFPRADSIMIPFATNVYDLHATATGRFDFTYTISADSTDGAMANNTAVASMYVSDTIFSKSRYDFVNKVPFALSYNRFNGADPFVGGPLYYFAKGGYQVKAIQFAVSAGTGLTPESFGAINVNMYKWTDINTDSIMENNEVQLIGVAQKSFVASDSNQTFFTVNMGDPFDNTKIVKVQDNSWYWVAADMPAGSFLGCDGLLNYIPRTFVRSRVTSESHTIDMYAPSFDGNGLTLSDTSVPDLIRPIGLESFIRGSFPDSARFAVHKGLVPSISMLLSKDTRVGINNTAKNIGGIDVYPNPSTSGQLNVNINLVNTSSTVYARIMDAMGKTVKVVKYNNLKNQVIQFSTSDLASGQYYVIVNTDAGPIARKFTVANK